MPPPQDPPAGTGTGTERHERRDKHDGSENRNRCDRHERYNDPPQGVDPTAVAAMAESLVRLVLAKIPGAAVVEDLELLAGATLRVLLNRTQELVQMKEDGRRSSRARSTAGQACRPQEIAGREIAAADPSGTGCGHRPGTQMNVPGKGKRVGGGRCKCLRAPDLGDIQEVDPKGEKRQEDEPEDEGPRRGEPDTEGWLVRCELDEKGSLC